MGMQQSPKVPAVLSKFDTWCIRQVQHILTEEESINYLDTYERYLNGGATFDDVLSARCKIRSFDWEILGVLLSTIIHQPLPDYLLDNQMVKIRNAHSEYIRSGKVPNGSIGNSKIHITIPSFPVWDMELDQPLHHTSK